MSQRESLDLQPGTVFADKYEIVEKIGAGGFGAVYRARQRGLDKPVALKVLHGHMVDDPEVVTRFQLEARIIASLPTTNIVTVLDAGEVKGVHFIAMELLEGESLKALLTRRGALPLREAIDLVLPVFVAVAQAHDRGVLHRDIKPGNIFLTNPLPGEIAPKLLDFGIAKLHGSALDLTASNMFLGSIHYMSPEQMRSLKETTPASDQWSLAVMTYQCLAGRMPFLPTNTELVAVLMAESGRFPRPQPLEASIPAEVEAAITQALAREPSRRHASVRAFGAALLPYAGEQVRLRYAGFFRTSTPPHGRAAHRDDTDAPSLELEVSRPPAAPRATAQPPAEMDGRPHSLAHHQLPVVPRAPQRARLDLVAVAVGALAVSATLWGALRWRAHDTPRPVAVRASPSALAPAPSEPRVAATSSRAVVEPPARSSPLPLQTSQPASHPEVAPVVATSASASGAHPSRRRAPRRPGAQPSTHPPAATQVGTVERPTPVVVPVAPPAPPLTDPERPE